MTQLSRRSFLRAMVVIPGGTLLLAACGSSGGMAGMNHGSGTSTSANTEYDQTFIDAMVPHHQSAIEMAKVAQGKAEHPELKSLANAIVADQDGEIAKMKGWRKAWYGSDTIPAGMGGHSMGGMDTDPKQLANAQAFDKAFIDAMIPHHQSAIDMAKEAQTKAKRSEVKGLATDIIAAQQREIDQMRAWRTQWYPGS